MRAYGLPELIMSTSGVSISASTSSFPNSNSAEGLIEPSGRRTCGLNKIVFMDTWGTTNPDTYCYKTNSEAVPDG